MIEVLAVPQKDHYEHKYSLYSMIDGASRGDCVEWIISSRYDLKGSVCVCVTYHMYSIYVCVPLRFPLEIRNKN